MGDLSFGAWLRQRRRALDLTQAELAARLFCAKGTVRRLEADDLRPSKQLAEQIAAVFAVPDEQRAAFIAFARTGAQDGPPVDFVRTQPEPLPSPTALPSPAALPSTAPPVARTARRYPLPSAASPLLGRAHTVEAAVELLLDPDVRLVTLVGPPGVGKTRLALAIAREIQGHFHEGVCFVPLAPVSSAERVLPAIAQALDLLDSGRSLAAALADRLRSEEVLLVLDNLEHLLAATAEIAALLAAAPSLKLLCTSRTALRSVGEHEFFVPPLPLPDLIRLPGVDDFAQNPALALFVARAQAIHPGFAVTAENLPPLAAICHRLDGLPLAIELAAARSKLLSPAAMLERLRAGLALLSDPHLPPRHRTLQATLAWSFNLLGPAEQRLFMMLSALPGTFDLAAIEAVGEGLEDVFAAVEALLDNSLLQQIEGDIVLLGEDAALAGDEVRFRMLSLVRQYAAERLAAQPYAADVHRRVAAYCLQLAEQADSRLRGQEQGYWLRRLEVELPNVRAALRWCLDSSDECNHTTALRLASALTFFWYDAGHFVEAERWLKEALAAAPDASTADRARALSALGIMAHGQGNLLKAPPYFEESLALYRQLGDSDGVALCLYGLGRLAIRQQDYARSRRLLTESLAVAEAAGLSYHRPYTINMLAALSIAEGNYAEAHARYQEALADARSLHNLSLIAFILTGYGELARLQGDYELAARLYREAMAVAEELHQKPRRVMLLHNLAHVVLHNGAIRQARQLFVQCLSLGMELPDRENFGMCLLGLGGVATLEGDLARAVRLFGAGEQVLASIGAALAPADQVEYDRYRARAQASLSPAEYAELFVAGQQLSTEAMETLAFA